MSGTDAGCFKIVAAPIGPDGRYQAWPDKTTYVKRFASEARRSDYWRRFVLTKSAVTRRLCFQLAMVDEWIGGWRFVAEPRYADVPIFFNKKHEPSQHIVEC